MLSFSFPFVVRWSAYLLRRGKVCPSCGIPCYSSGTRCWAAGSSESGGKLSRRCGCGIWSRRTLYATSSSIQRCMPSSRNWNEGSRVEISHQALLLTSFWKFTPPDSDGRPFQGKILAEDYWKDITERLNLITFDFFLLFHLVLKDFNNWWHLIIMISEITVSVLSCKVGEIVFKEKEIKWLITFTPFDLKSVTCMGPNNKIFLLVHSGHGFIFMLFCCCFFLRASKHSHWSHKINNL